MTSPITDAMVEAAGDTDTDREDDDPAEDDGTREGDFCDDEDGA